MSGRTAIIIVRHSLRLDAGDGGHFVKSNAGPDGRPFDPPLAQPKGNAIAGAAGKKMAQLIKEHGLGEVAVVASSPLVRCIETSLAFLPHLHDDESKKMKVCIEPALLEYLTEDWYRSWGVPGALGYPHWGGPPGCGSGVPVEKSKLHPQCLKPVGRLIRTTEDLVDIYGAANIACETEYTESNKLEKFEFCWDNFESEDEAQDRLGTFAEQLSEKYPGKTVVLCSHGGPSAKCWQYLAKSKEYIECGYTALFVLAKSQERGWETLVKGDSSHIRDVESP